MAMKLLQKAASFVLSDAILYKVAGDFISKYRVACIPSYGNRIRYAENRALPVLGLPELLEKILSFVDNDTLFVAQRVCQQWQETIQSQTIQQKLFLAPAPLATGQTIDSSDIRVNSLFPESHYLYATSKTARDIDDQIFRLYRLHGETQYIPSTQALRISVEQLRGNSLPGTIDWWDTRILYRGGFYESMQMCAPAVPVRIETWSAVRAIWNQEQKTIDMPAGVTIGQVLDALDSLDTLE